MKNSPCSLLAVGVCAMVLLPLLSTLAQDKKASPYVGTWELNVAKSDFGKTPPSHIPKSETLVIMPTTSDTDRKFTMRGVGPDGKPFEMSFDGATDGKFHPTGDNGASFAFLQDGSWAVKDQSGNVVETGSTTVSDDGKTLTSKIVRRTPDGEITSTAVYDRVK
jgi:hypothetical protein